MGPGTIYGTLERLEASGFVKELPAVRATVGEPSRCSRPAEPRCRTRQGGCHRLASLLRSKRLVPRES